MAERSAPRSLLDFAIAASVAVVPVLLGVVAAGRGRPPGRSRRLGAQRPQRPLRQRAPRRGAEDLRARDRARATRARTRCRRRRALLDGAAAVPARMGRRGDAARAGCASSRRRRTPPPPPAEQIAAQLGELDAALLRFSARPNRARRAAGRLRRRALVRRRRRARWRRRSRRPTYPAQRFQPALRRSRRGARRRSRAATRACSTAWPGAAPRAQRARALAARAGDARSRRAR